MMAGELKPKVEQRLVEAVTRLNKQNTDFAVFKKHLEDWLEYRKNQLMAETDASAFGQLQGRSRQLDELLTLINEGK